jgi:hypothetical protein
VTRVVFSTFSGNTSVMSASGGTGPNFRFAPGVSLQYQGLGRVGGFAAEMKRIIDLDKLQ